MKCSRYDETCDCAACKADRKDTRIERARSEWRPGRVTRSDAGGSLVAPVSRSGGESGHTPSYDYTAIQRLCDSLNAREMRLADQLGEQP